MTDSSTRNDFLPDLLSLQQDGKQAISAPTNWTTQSPLLEVETEVDEIIDGLADTMLVENSQDRVARWHFFIGSPGNGKSAAVGKLCRKLISELGCRIQDEGGSKIEELESSAIPYALDVFERGNPFASVRIVQDASVVRNPFSPDIDPARELIDTLIDAWERGISLVICTNRGVLEKAYRDCHIDQSVNRTSWFKILKGVVNSEATENSLSFDAGRKVFEKLQISYKYLDNRSLLIGIDIFERLVLKAVAPDRWAACNSCETQQLCPFKANRDWLADDESRGKVLKILQRAEAFSGQVIVFRESLALLSFILAGCPRDYENIHPCDWVRQKSSDGDIFSIATRRIYMSLLTAYSPCGLDNHKALRKRQLDAIEALKSVVETEDAATSQALSCVLERPNPSTDVGIGRLIGADGVLSQIDPLRGPLDPEFYDAWDSDYAIVKEHNSPLVTEIERRCADTWINLESVIEATPGHHTSELHWAIRRWSSNYFLHLGSLTEGRTAWQKELDQFIDLLNLLALDPTQRSTDQTRMIRRLDEKLESLLNSTGDNPGEQVVPISESATLVGRWVRDKLRPRIAPGEKTGGLSLSIKFEGGETATFIAPIYLWLSRRERGRLDPRCFPQEILSGVTSARTRAAAKGRYAFENDDVEIEIDMEDGTTVSIVRFNGDVDITND